MASYCPSVSGCRAVVEFKDVTDMKSIEVSDEQLRLAFNTSHADVWLVLTYLLTYFYTNLCSPQIIKNNTIQ